MLLVILLEGASIEVSWLVTPSLVGLSCLSERVTVAIYELSLGRVLLGLVCPSRLGEFTLRPE